MLLTLFYFLLALLLLVIVHEYGHFQVARWCGVKVLRFSFGFGKILASWKDKKGTEYTWSLLPLGGYVKMLDETEGTVSEAEKNQAFNRKSVWARIAIVLAGPLANFLLAFCFLWMVATLGVKSLAPMIDDVKEGSIAAQAGLGKNQEIIALNGEKINSWRDFQYYMLPYSGSNATIILEVKSLNDDSIKKMELPLNNWQMDAKKPDLIDSLGIQPFIPKISPVVGGVIPDSPAEKAGILPSDILLSMNDKKLEDWLDLVDFVKNNPGKKLQLQLLREGVRKDLSLVIDQKVQQGKTIGTIGLYSQNPQWPAHWLRIQKETPWNAVYLAGKQTFQLSVSTLTLIGRMVTGKLALDGISGPVGIAQGAGNSARAGLEAYLSFLALLSISLGVLNLLPVPLLDGGHLLYYVAELIIRRPVSEKMKITGVYIGVILLGTLMVIAFGNDILRLVPHTLS